VFGLVMFSGQSSGFRSFGATLTKTELAETRRSYPKKTVCFKNVCLKLVSFHQSFDQTSIFASSLVQYDNILRVKFRVNFKMLTLLNDRGKLFQSNHNSNDSSEESDLDKS
jgi:hypothetical protein